jgi:hypothetical protein
MKTAMELLIEKIDKMESNNISIIKIWANELLEKEKQQIEEAFDFGYDRDDMSGEEYFNNTYKNID